MVRCFPPITVFALLPLLVQARDVYYQGDLAPLNIEPTFDKGYLAVYEPEHTIALYKPDGSLAFRAVPQVSGAKFASVRNATPDDDGSLAIAVEYRLEKRNAGGVAVFDRAGRQTAFIVTSDGWSPTQVCFGADHSIWAIGWMGLNPPATGSADYFVLRKFSRDGRMLGAFLPRSSFEQEPVGPIVGGWQLRSANGRIGGLFYTTAVVPPGTKRRVGAWIEIDLLGNVVRQMDLPEKTIVAFTGDGSLYAWGYRGGYSVLSPGANSWRPVSGTGNLLGTDGSSLVFQMPGANLTVWSPID